MTILYVPRASLTGLPIFATCIPDFPPTMSRVASSRLVRTAGPLTASVRLNTPLTENQWQPGSCMTTVTAVGAVVLAAETRPAVRTTDLATSATANVSVLFMSRLLVRCFTHGRRRRLGRHPGFAAGRCGFTAAARARDGPRRQRPRLLARGSRARRPGSGG